MPITITRVDGASEADTLAQLSSAGFSAEAKDYESGTSLPHEHEYDVCLHVLEGEFRLHLVEDGLVRSCHAGDRVFVPAGTPHFEDHGPVRLVVGRRAPQQAPTSSSAKEA